MATQTPSFRIGGRVYHADTCDALVEATAAGRVQLHALARGHYPGDRLPRNTLPGVKTVGLWDATQDQDWGLDWHRNEGIELTYLETGSLPFAVEGSKPVTLHAGDLTITRPWQRHRVGDPNVPAGRLHWVILDVGVRRPNQSWKWPAWLVLSRDNMRRLTDLLRLNETPVWSATDHVRHCFRALADTVEKGIGPTTQSRLAVHVNELLLSVLELFQEHRVELDHELSGARRTVDLFLKELAESTANLALPWTVASMAKQCGLGPTAFTQHCKAVTNLSPTQYLNQCRVAHAERYLIEFPDRPITEIAHDCGFHSSQYFATLFKQLRGVTPRASRKHHSGRAS